MTQKILCFGELLIDFLNTGRETESGLSLPEFTQFPGGAPANACVAAARLGGNAWFAGQVGDDIFGRFLRQVLEHYQVNTTFLKQHPTAKTPLAFVFLDHNGDRSFEFIRQKTADLVMTPQDISDDWFKEVAIFHFCSNTLTDSQIAKTTEFAVDQARRAGICISFDVNLRQNLWAKGEIKKDVILPLLKKSHFIKFSKEEFDFFACEQDQDFIQSLFTDGVKLLVITDGGNPLQMITPQGEFRYTPPEVKVVDTTAGGDAFSGAMIWGLAALATPIENLTQEQLQKLVIFACLCGNHAVGIKGAFTSLPTLKEVTPDFL